MEHDGDPLLFAVLSLVESTGTSVGLVIAVGGVTLSGLLVSTRDYAVETENSLGFVLTADEDRPGGTEAASQGRPEFIHLRIATVDSAAAHDAATGALWRCRIDRIDAWSLRGELVPVPAVALTAESLLRAASGLG